VFYENELKLLRSTLEKLRINSKPTKRSAPISEFADADIFEIYKGTGGSLDDLISNHAPHIEDKTVYRVESTLGLNYLFFALPDTEDDMLFIGPYLTKAITPERILELEEKLDLSPKYNKFLLNYFSSVPTLTDSNPIFAMIDSFAELIFDVPSVKTVDIEPEKISPVVSVKKPVDADDPDSIMLNVSLMEKRYQYENELMQAVAGGHIHKANVLLSNISSSVFEKRLSDPVRNLKNYGVIINTLMRKAAESGGVHPVYLDSLSSTFASRIEQIGSTGEARELMGEIFKGYCRLVRKHSMKDYSPIVQKSIIFIDSDLSSNLSLSVIAKAQNISPGYLSAIFKKETGKTITEYIAERRINHATHLLATTHLQIQTIALHCGIMDVQYFSKIFKRITGMTPKEYRESLK
jgi:AraC-like DNA-binding protein